MAAVCQYSSEANRWIKDADETQRERTREREKERDSPQPLPPVSSHYRNYLSRLALQHGEGWKGVVAVVAAVAAVTMCKSGGFARTTVHGY